MEYLNKTTQDKQAQIDAINKEYAQKMAKINMKSMRDNGRIALGGITSALSFHPILNIPYIGTGLGGALFDVGQGIIEGDKIGDLAKRAGRGFAIGETVGAVPYVGKAAGKTKAGQAVGKQLDKVAQKVAANPAVQKAYDALMTDVKAFNPNKQTVYHGSPYDFEKFSNEAIGTGEGAQAHGMGHYAAKSKNIADERYRKRFVNQKNIISGPGGADVDIDKTLDDNVWKKGLSDDEIANVIAKGYWWAAYPKGFNITKEQALKDALGFIEENEYNLSKKQLNRAKELLIKNSDNYTTKSSYGDGQLYKLSVPKDDVMLREDLPFSQQPKAVQEALNEILFNERQNRIEDVLKNHNLAEADKQEIINTFNDAMNYNSEKPMDVFNSWKKLQKLTGTDTSQKLQKASLKDTLYQNDADITGGTFYNNLGKNANDLLQQKGIKGISYNGGIDGEARVIFNPDDIDIVRKYYNQPTLKDIYNKFINSGTFAGALTNP